MSPKRTIQVPLDINSQHHNLLGNQISPKSEDFCISVAMVTKVQKMLNSLQTADPFET
jgi:hypothetical protein